MKKREKLGPLFLASTALFLFLIFFSSIVSAANNGNALASQDNNEETIKVFDKAVEINAQDSEAWCNKGADLALQGNYEEALYAFNKAIEYDPQCSAAWYNKGTALFFLGNYEEALYAFNKTIEIDPEFVSAWYNKGLTFEYLGDSEEAVRTYDKAIEIDPQNLDSWINKGRALRELNQYEESIKACDKALEINTQDSDPWFNKGLSLECLGNYKDAIKAFDKAIEINSQDSYTWTCKGTCLAHLGNYKEAEEALDKAIEIDPQNSEALSLKESILSNSNGLMMPLRSLFSNKNLFVEEDNLLEYADAYIKTYEDIINESNLTHDDLKSFSFYQGYPYSVNANVSTSRGASIMFIPNSTKENRVSRVLYPIEELITKINEEEIRNNSRMFFSFDNASGISLEGCEFNGGYIYINNTNSNCFYRSSRNFPIILAEGTCFNGFTYIESNKLFREGEFIINGTLILNDSKVIIKSNLKKDWTKERAEEDAIDFICNEQLYAIFDYSKLTGLGFREVETLVTDYNEKENSGYYETNKKEKWKDRQTIFSKAGQYGIPYESVLIEFLDHKQEETISEKMFNCMDKVSTIDSFIFIIIGIISWIKRKDLYQKLKSVFKD